MKKAVLAFAAALSLVASAAKWERAGALQVADQTGLTAAVAKLGEIGGNAPTVQLRATEKEKIDKFLCAPSFHIHTRVFAGLR